MLNKAPAIILLKRACRTRVFQKKYPNIHYLLSNCPSLPIFKPSNQLYMKKIVFLSTLFLSLLQLQAQQKPGKKKETQPLPTITSPAETDSSLRA